MITEDNSSQEAVVGLSLPAQPLLDLMGKIL
jgi:hypothetical protein